MEFVCCSEPTLSVLAFDTARCEHANSEMTLVLSSDETSARQSDTITAEYPVQNHCLTLRLTELQAAELIACD